MGMYVCTCTIHMDDRINKHRAAIYVPTIKLVNGLDRLKRDELKERKKYEWEGREREYE